MLHIAQIDNGVFDLRWDKTDSEPEARAQTVLASAVFVTLFTNAATDLAQRVPQASERQGWWHNPDVGSGLWHVRRQPLNDAARREAYNECQQRLQACDPALLDVQCAFVGEQDAGSVSGLALQIKAKHNGVQAALEIPLF